MIFDLFRKSRLRALVALAVGLGTIASGVSAAAAQEGRPYVLEGTQVWTVPDPVSGRIYEVFVSLPPSYATEPQRRYPTLYVADADYGFPLIRSITRRVNLEGQVTQEFILIGLSYAKGEDGMTSRRRDYTQTENAGKSAPKGAVHGGGKAYQQYLKDNVLPFMDAKFRTDPSQRVFMGHSYGALLGTQILLTEPQLFGSYILGSPSYWLDKPFMNGLEADYAAANKDLPANVYAYVGEFEAAKPGDKRYHRKLDMVKDLAAFVKQLKSRDYPSLRIRSEVLADENHLTVFPPGFTRGLIYTLPATAD